MPQPEPSDPVQVVLAFNDALNAGDVDAMLALTTPDSVFENTYPPPDGARYQGQAALRLFWEDFFRGSAAARIEVEEIFAAGERVVLRWVYQWKAPGGETGRIRGVDVYRVTGGLIAEKLSYVKG